MSVTVIANEIELSALAGSKGAGAPLLAAQLPFLGSVKVRVAVHIGDTETTLGELLQMKQGGVLALNQPLDQPLDVMVDGHVIARGSLVAVGDHFGVRLSETPGSLAEAK
jgi:flagellar motor switch protein FliN/FliY